MKIEIKYYIYTHNAVPGTLPTYDYSEPIEADTWEEVHAHIAQKRDIDGNKYKKEPFAGFDYISKQGAIILKKIKLV